MASAISRAVARGSSTFLTMSSRPETEMAAVFVLMPALPTASLIAATTAGGSLIIPSEIALWGNGTIAYARSSKFRPAPSSCTTLTALEPMSSPKLSLRFLNRPMSQKSPLNNEESIGGWRIRGQLFQNHYRERCQGGRTTTPSYPPAGNRLGAASLALAGAGCRCRG